MLFWLLLTALAVVIYLFNQHIHSYWSKLGIPYKEPTFLIGETGTLFTVQQSFGDYFANLYNTYKHKRLLGIYFIHRPNLVITDPLLIQDVMIKEFSSFHDRFIVGESKDPLIHHLFALDGQKWRDLRVKLSPTFTTGKLKGMLPVIRDCANTLQDFIGNEIKNGNDVLDIRDLLGRFTTSVISSIAFGVENDCITDPENTFRKMGLKIIQPSFKQAMQNLIATFFPELANFFDFRQVSPEVEKFILTLVRDTIEFRERNENFVRKDFMQSLIQLKNHGYVSVDKDEEVNDNGDKSQKNLELKKLTFNEVASQAFLFYIAGFETSSSTSYFCMLELCRNPSIQQKVQEEIDAVIKEANSVEITYEMLQKMKYLECCIDETLRKYPIIPILNRECSKDHTFAGTNWTIKKGIPIVIPVQGLHRDPEIYNNPMEFCPERFINSPNGNGKSNGIFYMPFGEGPRNCIGFRMGKLQTKLGLATILSKFSFELVDKSLMHKEIEVDPKQFGIVPKDTIKLKARARNSF